MTKKKRLQFLCVMDRLEKLDPEWDNSLAVLGELARRGHETWAADVPDIWAEGNAILGSCRKIRQKGEEFFTSAPRTFNLARFNLILIRKEPPVNHAYIALTRLLEKTARTVPVMNDPAGIRNNNEKLSILNFPEWIPKTIVTSSPAEILQFQKRLKRTVIVKPMDQKGGRGIFLIHSASPSARARLLKATHRGRETLMAKEFIQSGKKIEKRIVLLCGKVLAVYEKGRKERNSARIWGWAQRFILQKYPRGKGLSCAGCGLIY